MKVGLAPEVGGLGKVRLAVEVGGGVGLAAEVEGLGEVELAAEIEVLEAGSGHGDEVELASDVGSLGEVKLAAEVGVAVDVAGWPAGCRVRAPASHSCILYFRHLVPSSPSPLVT